MTTLPPASAHGQDQDRSHLLTQELLPWIVNGTATDEQRAAAAGHLAACPDCQAELALQERIQAGLQLQPAAALPDCDAGLQRLMQRIDLDALCDQPAPQAVPQPRRHGWSTYALAAVALLQTAALALVGYRMADQESSPYRMFSSPQPTPDAATGAQGTIRAVPDERLTLAAWNAALAGSGLQVVGGPNAMGAYTLAPLPGTSGTQALEQLRATAGMRLVEPAGDAQ
ncbi:zf-HC2 domain-containing protein [Paracidovorax citrulli]|uniref:Zinc-finger domain-containing protein n=2 Tax=Paracidovorax citrulli TaxID=80869 RepID=A1TQB8_PARC0|nr:hypothetical protein [Paracidovorax citrulli]ABM33156.1 conserved hypothetical protein [Paracidovorax citrulli AAC00-1]ATG92902.1 hypothetical protein CQB05_01615 [Paracidovorax citrulli]PVY67386.1 hypothetical protein C8E08_4830 [Paracidovorax citrulli]QCX13122.1 hypothetical protein APS58_4438 [Paracidovorax citrulli]REG68455.1 hypothetical protein C8E07_1562 [Paracidovorax citrulli]